MYVSAEEELCIGMIPTTYQSYFDTSSIILSSPSAFLDKVREYCFLAFSSDPEERVNLINDLPEVAEELEHLGEYDENRVDTWAPLRTPGPTNPDNFGGYWAPGWCEVEN